MRPRRHALALALALAGTGRGAGRRRRAGGRRAHAAGRDHALVALEGGDDEGDPCLARAHHGFNGLDAQVVDAVVGFVLAP